MNLKKVLDGPEIDGYSRYNACFIKVIGVAILSIDGVPDKNICLCI